MDICTILYANWFTSFGILLKRLMATPAPAASSKVYGAFCVSAQEVLCDHPTKGYTGFPGQDLAVVASLATRQGETRRLGSRVGNLTGIPDQMIRSLRRGGFALPLVLALSALGAPSGRRAWAQTSAAPGAISLRSSDDLFALPCSKCELQQRSMAAAGLLTMPPSASTALDAESTLGQASGVGSSGTPTSSGQTASAGDPAQPARDEPSGFSVNPVTGLVSASAANYQPLTGIQRVKLYFKQNFWSVGAYFGPFASALVLDQTTGSPAQWGGGFSGYGKRVASRLATGIVQGTVQAPVAALLHEDVRYIISKEHGLKRRAWHAVVYSFVTYNNHGQPTANIANLSSYYAASAVSATWLPGYYNVGRYALIDGSESVGLSIPVNLLQEFWPEIVHYVFRRP